MAVTAHSRRPQDQASFLPTERNEHHASQLFFSLPRTHLTAFAADVPCAVLSRDLWNERGPRTRAGRRHHRRVISDDVIAEVEDGGARLSQARCAGGSAHLGPGRRLFRRDANAVERPSRLRLRAVAAQLQESRQASLPRSRTALQRTWGEKAPRPSATTSKDLVIARGTRHTFCTYLPDGPTTGNPTPSLSSDGTVTLPGTRAGSPSPRTIILTYSGRTPILP